MKIRIWHILFLFWLLIIIFNAGLLLSLIILWGKYFILLFSDFGKAIQFLDFNLFDSLTSITLFLVIPVILFLYRKKFNWLKEAINFPILVLLILLFSFCFAPLITNENPDFQKDLKVTKLLSPLSSVRVIHLIKKEQNGNSSIESFKFYKDEVVKPSFDESLIFADKVEVSIDQILYWQKDLQKKLKLSEIKIVNGKPDIGEKTFILGTDEFGRDIFTRLIYGARISLLVGIGSVFVSLIIGLAIGFVAGFRGGVIDIVFSRITDLFLAFPVIYLIILVLAMFGNSLLSVIFVLGFSGWMSLFKIVKSEVISAKNKDYIVSASLLGLNKFNILIKEILPVIIVPVIVNIIFQFSNVILAESALSYLGLGSGSSYPSWGSMIESGQQYITKAWWMILFPGLILILTIFSVNDLGKRMNKLFNPTVN
jgi:peptide/nickel transport system permease protein